MKITSALAVLLRYAPFGSRDLVSASSRAIVPRRSSWRAGHASARVAGEAARVDDTASGGEDVS